MIERGRITAVEEQRQGDVLAADATAGDTAITVEDAADFDETGGSLRLVSADDAARYLHGPMPPSVTSEIRGFAGVDDATGEIQLTGMLANDWPAGSPAQIQPSAFERWAHVRLDDDADEEVLVRVPHALLDKIPVDIFVESEGIAVTVAFDEFEWTIADVLGRRLGGVRDVDPDCCSGTRVLRYTCTPLTPGLVGVLCDVLVGMPEATGELVQARALLDAATGDTTTVDLELAGSSFATLTLGPADTDTGWQSISQPWSDSDELRIEQTAAPDSAGLLTVYIRATSDPA